MRPGCSPRKARKLRGSHLGLLPRPFVAKKLLTVAAFLKFDPNTPMEEG